MAATTSDDKVNTSCSNEHSFNLQQNFGKDEETKKLLQHLLQVEKPIQDNYNIDNHNLTFSSVDNYIDRVTESLSEQDKDHAKPICSGRIGPTDIHFDISGNFGTMIIEADRLGVASHSNFSTIRANTCVYKGKWMFEVMLGSKGVMQIGWCTKNCKFSQEEGVGDTKDSYAYDGNRVRKWNTTTMKYGEPWLTGDVITCSLDCDEGTISYMRNGCYLGIAFTNVKMGPGLAYFPAVSLSMGENVRANFGNTPFRFPMEGYTPLQDPPKDLMAEATWLFGCFDKLLPLLLQEDQRRRQLIEDPLGVTTMAEQQDGRSRKATLTIVAGHLIDRMVSHLQNDYIVDLHLLHLLRKYTELYGTEQTVVHKVLELLWMLLQDEELKNCLDCLMKSLLNLYRFSVAKPHFTEQTRWLTLCLAILQHSRTRKYLIKHVLFSKIKFPIFLHIKPLDDDGFVSIISDPWWGFIRENKEMTKEETLQKEKYLAACEKLHQRVKYLEDIQVEIMKTLLINTDKDEEECSTRFVFMHKFRDFLKENCASGTLLKLGYQCALPVTLCFFHRLIRAVRCCWDEQNLSTPSSEIYVHSQMFYNDNINYFDIQRLGGLYSHLKKIHRGELYKAQGDTIPDVVKAEDIHPYIRDMDESYEMSEDYSSCKPFEGADISLLEIVDGIVMLYNASAHKQLGKMCNLRDALKDFVNGLEDTEKKLKKCPEELPEVYSELKRAKDVFLEKATDQTRHMAWVISVIYAREKQEDVYWLLQVVLRSLKKSSNCGNLFSFVPDYYVEVAISAYNALRGYFHPTVQCDSLPDFNNYLKIFAAFLCEHFADARIVNSDIKDSLVQALACFVCYPKSLEALEQVPQTSQKKMMNALLSPYENRSWAQTNWILVRLWKGCGFGFRYVHLPHLVPVKHQQQEMGAASLQEPCPSKVFQRLIHEIMHKNEDTATKLIDSLLKQLNWAFSEFIGMLQEIQSIASQSEPHRYIDSRQLKICATCFDISVGLMRVLEMVVHLSPDLITDFKSRPSAELLLSRLLQCVCQILNRVTARQNLFEIVVNLSMPGLETVDHFPILTAIAGILVRLLCEDDCKTVATTALLSEPSFQPNSLDFLLGGSIDTSGAAAVPKDRRIFSFKKYKEINEEEVKKIESLTSHLQEEQQAISQHITDIHDDDVCNICYARPKSVVFQPCQHESCKPCIQHHMMTKKQCFFCMATITIVTDSEGNPILI